MLRWNNGGLLNVKAVGKAGVYGHTAAQQSAFGTGIVTLPAHDAKSTGLGGPTIAFRQRVILAAGRPPEGAPADRRRPGQ